jgi:hypothetical protein
MSQDETARLVRSKQRVADHGEVFTPAWMVEDMLNLVQAESERVDSRVLEPACGSGNFLLPVLTRKFTTVQSRHGKSDFEKRHYALFALMCIYGIELLDDNARECRDNLMALFDEFLGIDAHDVWARAASAVLAVNIAHGKALTLTEPSGGPITFAEWSYLGKGKYQRRDFRCDALTTRAELGAEGSLSADIGHDMFAPTTTYPTMTVNDIAKQVKAP